MKIIECPRDAMQGFSQFIPTELKVEYLNLLLDVGFDTLDCGSFVSPSAVPQMRDTTEVLRKIKTEHATKLLVIVANKRGADEAVHYEQIHYLGFPFSISETFQRRNTNSGIQESLVTLEHIQNVCIQHRKKPVVYLSMGFGNPYKDPWSVEILTNWVDIMAQKGIQIISVADTVGLSSPDDIGFVFKNIIPQYPGIEFGAHLHSRPDTWKEKVDAAFDSGCTRFDSAIRGFGGCPFANDELTGNIATENLMAFIKDKNVVSGLNEEAFAKAFQFSSRVFH